MKQSELYENIQDVRSSCFAKQEFEPCETLKDLGVCIPWKDSFFVNWKTDESHLGMDFATYLSKAKYHDLCKLGEVLYELAQDKKDFDPRDWEFDSDDDDYDEPKHCLMNCMTCQNYYAGLCSECDGSNMYYEGAD